MSYAQQLSHQHVPFTTNNLRDFGARVTKLYFVFNLNDEMMRENQYYYGKQVPMLPYGARARAMGIPLLASVPTSMMQPIQIQLLPQLVQMMDQVKTGLEGAPSEMQYLSNFEILVDALKVRKDLALPNSASDVLNKEEEQFEQLAAEKVPILALISAAFKQIDVFGLRTEYLERDDPVQALYIPTLSAFRFEVA